MMRRRAAFLRFSIPGGAGGRLRRCREAWLAALLQLYLPAARVEADSLDVVITLSLQLGEN